MEKVKKYFKKEFRLEMFSLEHDNPSDFCITCWQRNLSSLPLLFLRTLVFVVCLGTLVFSLVISLNSSSIGMWFLFMTHWGVILITLSSGFAVAVSLVAFFQGSLNSSAGLPWYVKTYWALCNTSVTVAFFITIFYWSLLSGMVEDYGMDPVLDVLVHAINSVIMLVLVLISRHPTRLLHFYFPLGLGIIYVVFSIIFHLAGGISPFGESWIYPMLDWGNPGPTTVMVVILAILFVVMHAVVVAITVARDAVTKQCRTTTTLVM